ncbi:hypothetical protein Kpol_413p14 [Vanderwaltozyma polyspora DSM 70294]|uniref:Double-strand break repair protein n=1 Tax=Vanderwaltozyma polyspora (strain ATCC 22028 / DSM 70294 / BCRC 21397 / CBS 2163 / NBRC 10782 / NRRL Y-8283 / UCD 57-17) TaxID=436907 RepID=A7TRH9_VANPO|nr:uncharacterized protein Kpol_413p14 [Vanderwaltozyma polyspora DSM 70294]EDO15139.1 hypothetical protein Kpol_413p14 [Vanderwaltozyma polyspora DSM 70294]
MDYPSEDIIRILITTDNHVGYNENDPITGDDSWKTFHEIMMIAKNNNVDMVLQAGDLFHVNKPSKKSMYQVMKSLRLACMGDKPCELELLSDPSLVFYYNEFTNVNYEDPNYNVAIPVFCIAGNHDDATGDSLLCPMDLLQVSGLVNNFGKVLETDKIKITPLLFQKGKTKLALYGLASVRDERLFRTFKEGNVTFEVPTMLQDEWVNIMCVHQNHTGHTNTAFLPEQFLPDFLDLVIWGHEHECIPHLVHNPTKNFDVLQPGSSVATSLCDAEAKTKYVFILEIEQGRSPVLKPIPLTTSRTFIMRTIALQDVSYLRPHDKESITKYLVNQVEEMIEEANEETKKKLGDLYNESDGGIISELPLPLIRLRVDYTGPEDKQSIIDYQVENPRRFSNRFVGSVANSNNVIQFFKRKKSAKKSNVDSQRLNTEFDRIIEDKDGELEVQTLVNDLLSKMSLSLLPEVGLNEAVKQFVDKDEKSALKEFIDKEIVNEVDILINNKEFLDGNNPDELKKLIKQVKRANSSRPDSSNIEKNTNVQDVFDAEFSTSRTNISHTSSKDDDIIMSDIEEPPAAKLPSKKSKTPAKGRTRTTKRTPPISDSIVISDSGEEDIYRDNDNFGNNNNDVSEDEDDLITLTSDEEEATPRIIETIKKKNSRKKATPSSTKRSALAGKKETKTPKTDILQSLLNKKRR